MAKTRKNIRFSVILIDGKRFPKIVRAPAGRLFTETAIENLLAREAEIIDKYFPGREFRLVPLTSRDFNFVEISKEEAELRSRHSELQESCSQKAEAAAV